MDLVQTPLGSIEFEAVFSGRVEVRTFELPNILQNGMTLERVVACVLVVEPNIDNADLVFSGQLVNGACDGSPESGESLECILWSSPDWSVSLGTEDREALFRRLACINPDTNSDPITYSRSALKLSLTGLQRGRALSFHFVVAYKKLPDERGCSTWFAVDVPHNLVNKTMYAPGA